jgi:hypothetical protein
MGAAALKDPSFALNEVEANRLAVAVKQVQDQYPFIIDPKTQAWINLASIGGMIYVPRLIKLSARKKQPKEKENPQPAPQTDPVSEAPALAPKPKGPLSPADIFGPGYMAGAE